MAKAKGSGRKKGGWMRVRKRREVKPDGAHAYSWAYQAKMADALAESRDRERTAQAGAEAAAGRQKAQAEKKVAEAAAAAQRQARLSPRACLLCRQVLPPEAFEPHPRGYNGRMGACRPCAQRVRDRKAAPRRRRSLPPPRLCRSCGCLFAPLHGKRVYCSDGCRRKHQQEAANARRRKRGRLTRSRSASTGSVTVRKIGRNAAGSAAGPITPGLKRKKRRTPSGCRKTACESTPISASTPSGGAATRHGACSPAPPMPSGGKDAKRSMRQRGSLPAPNFYWSVPAAAFGAGMSQDKPSAGRKSSWPGTSGTPATGGSTHRQRRPKRCGRWPPGCGRAKKEKKKEISG